MRRKVYVYIDSFNLYYGFMKSRRFGCKWLNLDQWLSALFPNDNIEKIKFFTASVSGKIDPTKPVRQQIYFRALRTLKNLEIIEGNFITKPLKIHVTQDVSINAIVPEEKCTDVNLGVHLVNDAHLKRFDVAIVVSNDSDLSEAIRIVTKERNLKVGILNPYENFSKRLIRDASFKQIMRESVVIKSQFPNSMTDSIGTFVKPQSW